ncbi:hypothetical protein [Krasilnikovia sp. MM14-A1004]|uniref:hypothetical protein n=1 Tax=Krasilnikovia sp. MM14-A1004 TaxID=3373541 RepID=UPI00399C599E
MVDLRDFRTLRWSADEGPWSSAASARFAADGYEALSFQAPRGLKLGTLDFVRDLPGLRGLSIDAPVLDDSAVNDLAELEYLSLVTGSRKPLAVDRLERLTSLVVTGRRDLLTIGPLARLCSLVVAGSAGSDMRFLGDKPLLQRLRLDGRPGHLRLDGLDRCPKLTELLVQDHQVASLSPLKALTELEQVTLSGPKRLPADNDLDLEHLTQSRDLHRLVLIAAGRIRSLAPLRRLTRLRSVRLDRIAINDSDLTPLSQLPRWTEVTRPRSSLTELSHRSVPLQASRPSRITWRTYVAHQLSDHVVVTVVTVSDVRQSAEGRVV